MSYLPKRIVISASSDIGHALVMNWLAAGCEVHGTYRQTSAAVNKLCLAGAQLQACDLANAASIVAACGQLRERVGEWDVLVIAAGTIEPIGAFVQCDFSEWSASIQANFVGQMHMLRELLPARRRGGDVPPLVLLFAGGGTNNATVNYSAYTLSKIALIKAVELLTAEVNDCRFTIVGPGWVKTKIHHATLAAGQRAGDAYRRTLDKLAASECVPMERVVECCNWLVQAPTEVINGRNFSTAFDAWGDPRLDELLKDNPDMYKLRRAGNEKGVGLQATQRVPGIRKSA